MEDIGKRLPPPLTPAEIELRDAMQAINANNGGLRTGLASPDAARIKEQIAALKTAFATADRFFKAQKAADAIGWTADAMKAIAAMDAAAAKAQWDDVRTAHATLGGLCTPCHGARRERLEDGSFRFRGEF
jgi:cytochrome c556